MKDVDEYIKDYLKTNNIERNNENFVALYMAWGNACFKQCENLEYENEKLKAENAELKARLEKAVELPPGNRVWFITEDEEGEESYVISKPTGCLTVNELYEIGKKYFTTCEAAKKAVEELKRRDKNG